MNNHVIGHSDINSVGRSYDPGPAFPMQEMIQQAGGTYERWDPTYAASGSVPYVEPDTYSMQDPAYYEPLPGDPYDYGMGGHGQGQLEPLGLVLINGMQNSSSSQ